MMDISYKRIARRDLEAQKAIFEFDGKYRFLSNFGDGEVVMYGITFPTVEHAFAAAKLDPNGGVHPRAEVVAEMHEIAAEETPGLAKKRGRRRTWNGRPFMRADWDEIKLDLITELVRRKFQDPALKAKLLATGDALLVEGNTWRDRIWGMVENKGVFEGQNMLGEILMKIRAELRAN
jgi:hypothetical protein